MKMRLSWRKHYDKFQSAGFFQYSPKERTSIQVFLRMCVPFSCIPNKDVSLRRFATFSAYEKRRDRFRHAVLTVL